MFAIAIIKKYPSIDEVELIKKLIDLGYERRKIIQGLTKLKGSALVRVQRKKLGFLKYQLRYSLTELGRRAIDYFNSKYFVPYRKILEGS